MCMLVIQIIMQSPAVSKLMNIQCCEYGTDAHVILHQKSESCSFLTQYCMDALEKSVNFGPQNFGLS